MKQAPRIRLATALDLPEIALLAAQAKRPVPEHDQAAIARHLSAYLSAGGNIFLASDPDGLDGFVLCRAVEPLFFAVDRSILIDAIFVSPSQRRRGIGHALLLAAANFAKEQNAGFVYSSPSAIDRGLHRFFASLGFAPLGGNRVVATGVLQRRLVREDPITQGIAIRTKTRPPTTRTPIDEIIAQRKRARESESTNA